MVISDELRVALAELDEMIEDVEMKLAKMPCGLDAELDVTGPDDARHDRELLLRAMKTSSGKVRVFFTNYSTTEDGPTDYDECQPISNFRAGRRLDFAQMLPRLLTEAKKKELAMAKEMKATVSIIAKKLATMS